MTIWRTSGARLRRGSTRGLRYITLENASLRVTLAIDRGADVIEFVDKALDVDFCSYGDDGPRPLPARGGFLDAYQGGWQDIFPSGGAPTVYRGVALDQHAEIAMLPWRLRILEDAPDAVEIELRVRAAQTPYGVRRRVRLVSGARRVTFTEEAVNLSPVALEAMWGQHIAFGEPFLRPGSHISVPAGVEVLADAGAAPMPWPLLRTAEGTVHDLSIVPAFGSPSEMAYLTGFSEGWFELSAPEATHGIRIEWDASVMPYLWLWRELGESRGYPFWGRRRALGLEPFSSLPTAGLAEAVRNGSALRFAPHETKEFTWNAGLI